MKNLLILAMLTIFIFACKDEGAEGPQEEEVIEEIFFHHYVDTDGNICDSVYINKETTTVIFKRFCENEPLFDTTFYNKDVGDSFIDSTFFDYDFTFEIQANLDSIFNFIDIERFFEFDDTTYINLTSASGGLNSKIKLTTNLREKNIVLKGKFSDEENPYMKEIYLHLEIFNYYHLVRLTNLHGRGYE